MYRKRIIEERSCKRGCGAKPVNATDTEPVFVDLVIQHTTRMRHIVICGMSGFTVFFNIIS
jgi:hypothetical protein